MYDWCINLEERREKIRIKGNVEKEKAQEKKEGKMVTTKIMM